MKRGKKPTPKAIKLLKGNPGRRPVSDEPAWRPGVPERPRWLDKTARDEWDGVVAELGPAGILVPAEQTLLAGYCMAVSRARRAERRALTDPTEEPRAEKAWDQVRKFAAVFGLGPAERSRVSGRPRQNEDPGAEYFRKRGRA